MGLTLLPTMSDMHTPLQWDAPELKRPATGAVEHGGANAEKKLAESFCWPTPPSARFPAAKIQTDPLPCEVTGLNGKRMAGRLTFFVPDAEVAHVQLPPARTTLALRFDQFLSLTLTTPLHATALSGDKTIAAGLGGSQPQPYRVKLRLGEDLCGMTVGHVEMGFGVFLFVPLPSAQTTGDSVQNVFIPKAAYESLEVGARIGELLVEQRAATPVQVEEAAQLQEQLRSQKLGDILLQNNVVTPAQLLEAIDRQSKMPMVRIGDALVSLGLISEAQLKDALSQQKADRGTPLGELLVRMNVVSPLDLQTALARKMGYPLVRLENYPADAAALKKLPYQNALRLGVMPLLLLGDGRLVVAIDDPSRRGAALAEVEFIAQTKVVPVLAQCKDMDEALFAAYSAAGATPASKLAQTDVAPPLVFDLEGSSSLLETLEKNDASALMTDDDRPIEQSDNSLVRLINTMIIEAYNEGASDIHVESYPGREKIRVRFRKDGLLRTYMELPSKYRSAMVARIKIMCDLDISERRKPQDGKINFAKFSAQHKIELRIATIPTNNNLEDVVMRILASAKPIPLERIGLSDYNLQALKRAVERPYGMVLCVGPTGSGKTTTLHSALSHINVPERKIWTAEDPVEITQPGLRQVQVNPKIEWTFAKALRSFLRADPDVIMVGEIRDAETAHMAIEASLTGHLVLSTLHTNSAPETVTRLLDMGMDPFNFADSLLAVLAQRLVRRWCSHCATSRPATQQEINELLDDSLHAFGKGAAPVSRDDMLAGWVARHSRDGRLLHHHSPGCTECNQTGFKGRVGLHELMVVSREVRGLIQTGARAEQLQQAAMLEGMRCLRHDGIEKVWAGLTSIEEVRATSNV